MKGVVLAGGKGSRLGPSTLAVSKHLLPVYDKPMIFYPLSILMLAGVREILVISTEAHIPLYESLLGDGTRFGIRLSYAIQESALGIAHGLIVAENFVEDDDVMLILGDNIFFGHDLQPILLEAVASNIGATIFTYRVTDPQRYGIVEYREDGRPKQLVEKPERPNSNEAVVGLYIYDNRAVDIAKSLRPSARGELEITALNQYYLDLDALSVQKLGRGLTWLDAGTVDSLHEASGFVRAVQERQGLQIACLEEIAWRKGWISDDDFENLSEFYEGPYGAYLKEFLSKEKPL